MDLENFESKEIAIVEIYPDGRVTLRGSWHTLDAKSRSIKNAVAFSRLSDDLGLHVAVSSARCDDVRVLPIEEARRLYNESEERRRARAHTERTLSAH